MGLCPSVENLKGRQTIMYWLPETSALCIAKDTLSLASIFYLVSTLYLDCCVYISSLVPNFCGAVVEEMWLFISSPSPWPPICWSSMIWLPDLNPLSFPIIIYCILSSSPLQGDLVSPVRQINSHSIGGINVIIFSGAPQNPGSWTSNPKLSIAPSSHPPGSLLPHLTHHVLWLRGIRKWERVWKFRKMNATPKKGCF